MCNRKIDCPSNYFKFIDVIDVKLLSNNYRSCNCQYPADITYKRPVFMSAPGSTTQLANSQSIDLALSENFVCMVGLITQIYI